MTRPLQHGEDNQMTGGADSRGPSSEKAFDLPCPGLSEPLGLADR
jgi:hypothetical protein